MGIRYNVLLSVVLLILCSLCTLIVFGDNGLAELNRLRQKRDAILQDNQTIVHENLSLYQEIDRLKGDYRYIEYVARNELGVIGKDEIIIKIEEGSGK